MSEFKLWDRVVFVRDTILGRNYKPSLGDIGVVRDISSNGRYRVIFGDDENNWTYCKDIELILYDDKTTDFEKIINGNFNAKEIYPESFICSEGSRGYGKSATEVIATLEIKTECLQKELEKLEKKMEEKEMKNEVLELWYTRRLTQISKVYDEKEREFNESIELVVKYNDIINRFENELKELYESEENVENKYIRDALSGGSMYKYKINHDKLRDEFVEKYISERNEKINELDELKREIDAQLSLSTDSEYQIDVLIRYGVLDKKTKKMVD